MASQISTNLLLIITMVSMLAAASVDLASVPREIPGAMATDAIERPSHRATSFVPRLGKRDEEAQPSPSDFNKQRLPSVSGCPSTSAAGSASSSHETTSPFVEIVDSDGGSMYPNENYAWIPRPSVRSMPNEASLLRALMTNPELMRETRATMDALMYPNEGKRVAFTPRIG